jgi:hypothetical protein
MRHLELCGKILAENRNVKPDERFQRDSMLLFIELSGFLFCGSRTSLSDMTFLPTQVTGSSFGFLEKDILSKYTKVRFMSSQTEHDEISILSSISNTNNE